MNKMTNYSGGLNPADMPSNIEAEQQLLGSLLNEPSRIDLLGGLVDRDSFFDPVHGELFERIRMRWKMNRPCGVFALRTWADEHAGMKELGGATYIAKLAGFSVSGSMFKDYGQIIRDLAEKRTLLIKLAEVTAQLREDDTTAGDASGQLEAHLMSMQSTVVSEKPVSMTAAVTESLARMKAAQEGESTGAIPTGIRELDEIISGMNPGDLWILAGRPSMGKSTVGVSIAMNMALRGMGVAFASYEMMASRLTDRAISAATAMRGNGVYYNRFDKGEMTETDYHSAVEAAVGISEIPMFFIDKGKKDVASLLAACKHIRTLSGPTTGLKALVVDYLQLMTASRAINGGRNFEIGEISMDLKSLAKHLEVPVIALSQLSRGVEQREEKRPMLSDLRDSGQIEQDADGVIFCYREAYYLERERAAYEKRGALDDWMMAMEDKRLNLELIVAKQRQGPIGTAHCQMNPALSYIAGTGK